MGGASGRYLSESDCNEDCYSESQNRFPKVGKKVLYKNEQDRP